MSDFLFRGSIADLDPDLFELTELEAERQYRRLILIPSESVSPIAVREAVSSAFHNIYAEGYPSDNPQDFTENDILNYEQGLGHYRRYSDKRYYKGVEYANFVENLARKRCADLFAANHIKANDIFVNVQALSGAPANNAVYHALVKPGDTVMGMDLLFGGHLTHGSPVNRSGKFYNIVHYSISQETHQLDFEQINRLAKENKPKMIIAGFSSYPWQVDWKKFKEIAESVGAYLLADISHVAGLIAAGLHPSPIGIADVITSTTHKTLCGPRGAIIMTTDSSIAKKTDRAVFPGEQGGPHVNVFAAQALAFKLAKEEKFKQLQNQIVKNCKVFTDQFEKQGFNIPFGGTNTHLMNLDVKSIQGPDGTPLSGDQAARILDLAGIVVNRNTIPGDKSALNPSGIRMGTPWITQRGLVEKDCIELADIIVNLLEGCIPYRQFSTSRLNLRTKIKSEVLEEARIKVRDIALRAGIDFEPPSHGYPHFYYLDDKPKSAGKNSFFSLSGEKIKAFLNFAISSDIDELIEGESQQTNIYTPQKEISGSVMMVSPHEYKLSVPTKDAGVTAMWLRNLSDGFVKFDEDLLKKIPGPVIIKETEEAEEISNVKEPTSQNKPYFIGITNQKWDPLPEFKWKEPEEGEIRLTALNKTHREMGAKMVPFAGWDMPVWYSSVMEEHLAVRQAAGLFDVSHMGVYQVEGVDAVIFLDSVCGNDISGLCVGQSLYTHFLDPDANVIDDLLVYRRAEEKYLVVVNASNDDKDWAWLNAVREGKVMVDRQRPWAKVFGKQAVLRNLRDPKEGKDMLVDIALQGPKSRKILLSLGCDDETYYRVSKLKRTELCEANIGGFDLVVSRTGYTGEKMAFELFVHPEKSIDLWNALLKAGESFGIKPCGLASRDSLRTEAGLPLYGHEMGGELNLGVAEAGFRSYVKTFKPWFIGRDAFLAREKDQARIVVRFQFQEKGIRMAHPGDPVVDKRGKTTGFVTSCAVDSEGKLTGQAYIEIKYAKKDTLLLIYPGASQTRRKAPAELEFGDPINIPNSANVLSRFPKL